jgi:putative DeoR family transcriptional regulator (stage III sporulation protein D)
LLTHKHNPIAKLHKNIPIANKDSFFPNTSHIHKVKRKGGGQTMQEYIRKRVLEICEYILQSNHTVRQTAAVFGVSKSTVHKDMTERLPIINKELANQVREVLEKNKAERHLRGGEATKRKYLNNSNEDSD